MLEINESNSQFICRFSNWLGPTLFLGGTVMGLLALWAGSVTPPGGILAVCGLIAGLLASYDRSEFCFDLASKRVTGWRKSFLKTETFDFSFSDVHRLTFQVVKGRTKRYPLGRITLLTVARIALMTTQGLVPLSRTYGREQSVIEEGRQLHAWRQRHGVEIPLHAADPKPHTKD